MERVDAGAVASQARRLGFRSEERLYVPQTEEYLGSTVVMLRAP
jgi:hypothetical protein